MLRLDNVDGSGCGRCQRAPDGTHNMQLLAVQLAPLATFECPCWCAGNFMQGPIDLEVLPLQLLTPRQTSLVLTVLTLLMVA